MKDFNLDTDSKITTGFKTPENYFDELSSRILTQIPLEEPRVIPLYKRKSVIWMTAAAILIGVLFTPVLNYFNNPIKQVDEKSLETYLAYQTNLNQYDLINQLDTEDIEEMNATISFEDKVVEDVLVTNPNIENYISE